MIYQSSLSIVDSALKRCMLPSPIGTVLFSSIGLTRIRDDLTRRAMILRVLRYISFHPWGSIRADANRRGSSINRIINILWNLDPSAAKNRRFISGGGVLWTPVSVRGNRIKMPGGIFATGSQVDEILGWLASRQPPLDWKTSQRWGLLNSSRSYATRQIVKGLKEWRDGASSVIQVLYDRRFLVHFNIAKIPGDLAERLVRGKGNIVIHPHTRWYWPHVVAEWNDGTTDVLHNEISKKQVKSNSTFGPAGSYDHRLDEDISSEWIEIEWIRSLNAL
jgi:tRNA(Ile)-lysidine synthase